MSNLDAKVCSDHATSVGSCLPSPRKRELVTLHTETDKKKRSSLMTHFGDLLTDIVMPDLDTTETESSLELNFFIGKLKHTVRRVKRADGGAA